MIYLVILIDLVDLVNLAYLAGDLDKSDGFSESGESIVPGNLVIIVILVILVLPVKMVILVILIIGNFIITFVSQGRPIEKKHDKIW